MIPILSLERQYQLLKTEIDKAVAGVLAAGHFINGPNVEAFEGELAQYIGVSHAVGLNSGTDAIHLALRALGVAHGHEVITTPFTFIATAEAIEMVGAVPVFVDIDPSTFNIDPNAIEAAITPRTRAILPVHLYGLPSAMNEIAEIAQRHALAVIEDCAQSIGSRIGERNTGTIGAIGALSFFPSKNLGAFGDAGAIVTSDPQLAAHVRRLRAHGAAVKYYHDELGVNSRLDELQAAILRVKLHYLDGWLDRRRAIARRYARNLSAVDGVTMQMVAPNLTHTYHQFTVRVPDRERVAEKLRENGVQTMVYYPVPLHLQRVYQHLDLKEGSFPHAERAAREVLSLPIFPELLDEEVDEVTAALARALERAVA